MVDRGPEICQYRNRSSSFVLKLRIESGSLIESFTEFCKIHYIYIAAQFRQKQKSCFRNLMVDLLTYLRISVNLRHLFFKLIFQNSIFQTHCNLEGIFV